MHRRYYHHTKAQVRNFRVNQWINVPEVLVIDEDGTSKGVLSTSEALRLAHEQDLDLIEVSPNAKPPVCRIMNLGKWQYLQSQKVKKQKTLDVKNVRISFKIAEHDRSVKLNQALKFLAKGHKVKIEMRLRGRERGFAFQGKSMIESFITDLKIPIIKEQPPSTEGGTITAVIAKKG